MDQSQRVFYVCKAVFQVFLNDFGKFFLGFYSHFFINIGNMPLNSFLKAGWNRRSGSHREEVPLDVLVAHIDHICQLAGDALHAGIGSDIDGGFGVQSVPPEIDTIADLQNIAPLLRARGYSEEDAANVLGLNWVRFLEKNLPS